MFLGSILGATEFKKALGVERMQVGVREGVKMALESFK